MFCIPSFDEMTNLTPYFNHVIPAYAGIQTVSHSASQVEEISETGSYDSQKDQEHRPNGRKCASVHRRCPQMWVGRPAG